MFLTPLADAGSRIHFSTTFPDSKLDKGVQIFHISRFCSVFQVVQVISSAKFFPAEEVDFLKESRLLYDGLNRIGCRDGLSFFLALMVTDYK